MKMKNATTRNSGVSKLWRQVGYALLALALLVTNFSGLVASVPVQAAAFSAGLPQIQPAETKPAKDKDEPASSPVAAPIEPANGVTRNALIGGQVTLSNSTPITINDNNSATPYPSAITVQNLPSTINGLTVSLNGISHTYPSDIDILLVGPGGQKTILMSDVAGNSTTAFTNFTLNFDDTASNSIGPSILPTNGGTYKPSDDTGFNNTATDTFKSPAPANPYSVTLSVFNNTSPNGDWKLYIMDDAQTDKGSIARGWSITFYLNVPNVAPYAGNNQSSWLNYSYLTPLQASVKDENNNPLSNRVVTFTAPVSGASGTFAGGSNVFTGTTDSSGLVTATTFTANNTSGSFNLTLEAEGIAYPGSFSLTNLTSGAPSTIIVFIGNNQSTLAGTAFSQNLVVQVKDSNGNGAVNSTVIFSAPTSGASGTFLNNTTTYTATTIGTSGQATSGTFTANNQLGSYNVTATVNNFALSLSFSLTNSPPDPIQFESSSYTLNENSGTAVITLTRGSNTPGEIYANLEVNNLTTTDADYYLNSKVAVDKSFTPGTGTGSKETYKTIALPDGKILLGGAFTTFNSTPVTGVVRLNANGSLDTSFLSTGKGTNGTVHAMARQPDGKILIVGGGGGFTQYNGVARNHIARLNADGSLDTTFDPGSGPNNSIFRVALQPDGKIIIGGDFITYTGITRTRIARLNTDGSLDTTFAADGLGADNTVCAIAVQPDGKIVIGGIFTSYAGITATRIARLNADGSLDSSFTGQTAGVNDIIWDLALQPDGKIIAAGDFTAFNGVSSGRIVRLNATDGSRDASFIGGGNGANGTIRALAYQKDGKLLFGGDFSTFNTTLLSRVGRLNTDGSLDTSFTPAGSGPSNLIWSIASYTNNSFLVGGDSTTYDGLSRNHIARAGNLQVYWPAGDYTPKTISMTIVNDSLPESDEQLTISVANTSFYGAIGAVATTTLTIVDDGDRVNLQPISGGGQTTLAATPFSQTLVVAVQTVGQPVSAVAGVLVTFTAPISGASGTFAGGSNIFTGTSDASGLVTTTVFTANATPGSYSIVVSAPLALATASFTLTNTQNNSVINILPISGGGQSTVVSTSFANPLAVALQNGFNQPVAGAIVTFTAPISGASGTFAASSNVFTGTSDASGLVTTTLFTANAVTGSYQVVVTTSGAVSSAAFTLTNLTSCNPLVVTSNQDDGEATTCGTFSYALLTATSGTTITFALNGNNTITFSGGLTPTVKSGVWVNGGANGVILNGNGVAGDGLRLAGNNNLSNLTVRRFAGREIVIGNGAVTNRLDKVHAES